MIGERSGALRVGPGPRPACRRAPFNGAGYIPPSVARRYQEHAARSGVEPRRVPGRTVPRGRDESRPMAGANRAAYRHEPCRVPGRIAPRGRVAPIHDRRAQRRSSRRPWATSGVLAGPIQRRGYIPPSVARRYQEHAARSDVEPRGRTRCQAIASRSGCNAVKIRASRSAQACCPAPSAIRSWRISSSTCTRPRPSPWTGTA